VAQGSPEREPWVFEQRRLEMGLSLALIVMGILTLWDRMDMGYGFKEGWPWIVVALGAGRVFRNSRSITGWITMMIGILIVGSEYYTVHIHFPAVAKIYFWPLLLMVIGLIWLWKYRKD
jgi:hypothetical protein